MMESMIRSQTLRTTIDEEKNKFGPLRKVQWNYNHSWLNCCLVLSVGCQTNDFGSVKKNRWSGVCNELSNIGMGYGGKGKGERIRRPRPRLHGVRGPLCADCWGGDATAAAGCPRTLVAAAPPTARHSCPPRPST